MTYHLPPLAAVALVVLAGCAGGLAPAPDDGTADTGSVSFWISDQRNAIDQFEHLNVTVTAVGFVPAGDGAPNAGGDGTPATDGPDDAGDGTDGAGVVTYDVDNRTVDLTELQGENATLLGDYDLPAGTYAAVFVEVSEATGTLATGEQVKVTLPSDRLRLSVPVTVEADGSVDYVFDVAVHETGRDGEYVLRPVVSQSGPDVPFRDVGRPEGAGDEQPEDPGQDASNRTNDDRERQAGASDVALVGDAAVVVG